MSDQRNHARPLLSIGLPVYNGEKHLSKAIDSLLAQDVRDLELHISDNASTDGTQAICEQYARQDSRVVYHRNEQNIGAAGNFNRAWELCRGEFFMWGSDDDVWEPGFASACIAELRARPQAVMCTSGIRFIDQDGDERTDQTYRSIHAPHMDVESRIHELITRNGWFGIYSVIRPDALRATRLAQPLFGMDVLLQAELLMLGEALAVPATLFSYRLPDVYKTADDYAEEMQPDAATSPGEQDRPWSLLARRVLDIVRAAGLDEQIVQRIEREFVDTFVFDNIGWGWELVAEEHASHDVFSDPPAAQRIMRIALGLEQSSDDERDAWQLAPGMRLAGLRKALLRLAMPFAERQNAINRQLASQVARLDYESRWAKKRVRELQDNR